MGTITCISKASNRPSPQAALPRAGANAMAISLARGRRTTLAKVDAFADGVAVKTVRTNGDICVCCIMQH